MIMRLDRGGKAMNAAARRRALVRNDGAAREKMRNDLADSERVERTSWKIGFAQYANMHRLFGCSPRVGESLQGCRAILVWVGKIENPAILGRAPGRFVGICKETHRRARGDQNQLLRPFHKLGDLFGEVGNSLNRHSPGATLAARGKRITGDPRP